MKIYNDAWGAPISLCLSLNACGRADLNTIIYNVTNLKLL